MTREDSDRAVVVSTRPNNQRGGNDIIERYEERPRPRSEGYLHNEQDHAFRSPRPSYIYPIRRRKTRDISPWSSSSRDGNDNDDDDDDDDENNVRSITSHNHQDPPATRSSLLTDSPADSRKTKLLQEWIRDYAVILRQVRALYDTAAASRHPNDRSYENSRVQDVMTEAFRVELGPRSMTVSRMDVGRDGIIPPLPLEGRVHQSTSGRFRAEEERMYGPALRHEGRRMPDRSRGGEDDVAGASQAVWYEESRQSDR